MRLNANKKILLVRWIYFLFQDMNIRFN